MAYNIFEESAQLGEPVEVYEFKYGTTVYRYTSASSDVSWNGYVYTSQHAITRNAVSQDTEDYSGRVEISISRKSEVAKLYIEYLPTSQVEITINRFHADDSDPDNNFVQVFKGTVLTCKFNQLEATLKCAPMTASFKRVIPIHTFQASCNHTVFSQTTQSGDSAHTSVYHGCNANPATYLVDTTVQSVNGATLVIDALAVKADNYYQGGIVYLDNGETRMIRQQIGNTVILEHRIQGLKSGDAIKVLPGCDGQESTCRNKYNNVANFSGFSRIPFNNPFTTDFI